MVSLLVLLAATWVVTAIYQHWGFLFNIFFVSLYQCGFTLFLALILLFLGKKEVGLALLLTSLLLPLIGFSVCSITYLTH